MQVFAELFNMLPRL